MLNERRENQFVSLINPKQTPDIFTRILDDMQKKTAVPDPAAAKQTYRDSKINQRLMTIVPPVFDQATLAEKKPPGIITLGVDPAESSIGDQSLENIKKILFKVDLISRCLWIELQANFSKELRKYRVQIYFEDLASINLVSNSNAIELEAEVYATQRLASEQNSLAEGSFGLEWSDANLGDIVDWNLKRIKMVLGLVWDVSSKGLAEKHEILDRISVHTRLFTVDNEPYTRAQDVGLDDPLPLPTTTPKYFIPISVKESTDQVVRRDDAIERVIEEKVFEDFFKPNDLAEIARLEANELSRVA